MRTRILAAVALVGVLAAGALVPSGRAGASRDVWGPGWLKKMFLDEDEAPWAVGYMAKMKAKGLISGYSDGRYKPNASVSRVDLIAAAVKLIDADDEAESRSGSSLPFADEAFIRSSYSWAAGYLSAALNHGILRSSSDRFQPDKLATRLWTAEVFTRAMGLESAALAKMSATLGYRDEYLIPANKVGYVAVMRDKGIMTGSDNNFRPNYSVTRGELAVILDRCDEWMAPRASSELRGVISSVDTDKQKMSIRLYDREWWSGNRKDADEDEVFSGSTTLNVSPLALILVDDKYAALGNLRSGYRVVVLKSGDDEASVIDASTGDIAGWPGSTEIDDYTEENDDREDVDEDEDEDVGEDVDDDSNASQLVAGTVKSIQLKNYREITMRDNDGRTRTYRIADDCRVRLTSGRESWVEDIRAGDRVTLEIVSGEVVKVTFGILAEAISEDEVITGTILSVRSDRYSLIVETGDGSTKAIIVSENASIKRNGESVSLNSLREDDEVEIGMQDWEAVRIEAGSVSSSDYTGEVTRLSLDTSTRKITIKTSNGSSKTLELYTTVSVEFEGLPLEIEDVVVGDQVSLRVSSSKVRKVTIKQRTTSDVLGQVASVVLDDGYYRLRLKTSAGTTTYSMIPNVIIKEGSKSLTPRDLKQGASVVVRLAGDVVTKVTVLD
ncbi:MAG: S-layer homology domain-containing protein [Firmicutes bacterium]|nr:S-layer homology domain-containing protein [Bacillota bacterium]